jgi:DNA-binding response OmpR family regulator
MMNNTILIVEDDPGIRKYLEEILIENRFTVQSTGEGTKALDLVESLIPDLILLDLKLPDISGETICKQITKDYPSIAIIILTAKDTTSDIVEGLNLGADDYITKPFTTEELLARVKARLRNKGAVDNSLKVGDLELDTKTFYVARNGREIKLTPQEFKLLSYLMANKNQVLTREMILNRIWEHSQDVETRVVDVYIGYLRKKIDTSGRKKLIHSLRGFGYVMRD